MAATDARLTEIAPGRTGAGRCTTHVVGRSVGRSGASASVCPSTKSIRGHEVRSNRCRRSLLAGRRLMAGVQRREQSGRGREPERTWRVLGVELRLRLELRLEFGLQLWFELGLGIELR